MTTWKKVLCKSIVFLLVFSLLFLCAQEVLRHKGEYDESVKARFESYARQSNADMDIDVVYFGSSPIYVSIAPMVMYNEYGYTGMNFGTSTQSAMALYYSFVQTLEYSTPKVIVVDFNDLCEERLADHDKYYYAYRKATDSISSFSVKWQFWKDIVKTTGSVEYLFPMIRQHDRWADIQRKDVGLYVPPYDEYTKGVFLSTKLEPQELKGAYDTTEKLTPTAFALGYYEKLLALCEEKGIKVVGVTMPAANLDEQMTKQNAIAAFCKERDIPYFNYNDPQLVQEIGLNFQQDFYNKDHLNRNGAVKVSKSLATKLDALYNLPDHREDTVYAQWSEDWQAFYEENQDLL